MQTPLGPIRCVQNIEASIFQRLPVIFLVGVAICNRHVMAHFVVLLMLKRVMPLQ